MNELKKKRKVALRLGSIDYKNIEWILHPKKLKKLIRGEITVGDLEGRDVSIDMRQKGVDMKLGIDIASLSYKKQVEQIILIAGDSDFVPAAKLARREGIDFVLDSLWLNIKDDLFEHIDGRRSMVKGPDENGVFDGKIRYPKARRNPNLKPKPTSKP